MNTKRILAVGKVHDGFLSLRLSPRPQAIESKESERRPFALEAETDDYVEDQDDREFHARGGW